jgi:two-component system, NarL family, response regulator LiaR
MKDNEQIKICIVEDNIDLLEALSMMINFTKEYNLVGAYKNGEEAFKGICAQKPVAVLMDINLPGISGIECISKIKAIHPEILFLISTSYEDVDKIFESLQAGASGYILKTEGPAKIINALQEMINGGSPMSGSIARKVVSSFTLFTKDNTIAQALTDRENEVLEQLSKGLMNKEVADKMQISIGTVRKHIQHIYEKLHVNTRVEAVNLYLKR